MHSRTVCAYYSLHIVSFHRETQDYIMARTEEENREKSLTHRDWTQGSIFHNLLLLSWPMVLLESMFVISQIVDMIWVGRLGPSAIAGVGIANIIIMLVMSMDFGLIVGVRAMVARFVGAGDLPGANHIAAQAITLSIFWGGMMMIIGLAAGEAVMRLFGLETEVLTEGMAFMRVMFIGWIAMDVNVMALYIIQSAGDTIRPMWIEGFARGIHVILCPLLVLGLWLFPQMGVTGAALANIIAQSIGMIIALWLLFSGRTRLHLSRKDFKLDPGIMWRIMKIGIPALVMNIQRSLGNFILTYFVAPFGTLAVAAHSLVTRVQMFVFLPGMGLGMGTGVLVGQNLGARQPERAERSAWFAVALLQAIMIVCCIVLLIWAEEVIGVFTPDPELVVMGAAFTRIATAGFAAVGFFSILQHSIAGAGDTVPNMIISLAAVWVVVIPLAALLSNYTSIGVYGIRWAISAGTISSAIAYVIYFKLGRWKRKMV